MNLKITSLLIFILIFNISFSQNNAKAEKILANVKEKYNNIAFSIKFKHELKNTKAKVSQTEMGSAFIYKQKYNIVLNKAQTNQVYDGEKVYTLSNDEKEITVSTPKDNSELITPTKILDNYQKEYILSLGRTKKINKKKYTSIKLTPKKKTSIKMIEVLIDTTKNEMIQLIETNYDNTLTILTVTEFTPNIIATKELFDVDLVYFKKQGYIVTEL